MAEKKPKPQTRTPGAPRGLVLPERVERRPDENPMRETIRAATAGEPDPPQPTPSPTIPHQPRPIAPERDFNRRANVIERDALPAGMFPGSSKKLYDALYLRTRGAHPPRTSLRATKRDLMDWSGIRNVKTVETHMRYLVGIGLIVKTGENGDREGFRYEVHYPHQPQPSPTIPDGDRKTVVVGEQKTVVVGEGQTVDFQRTSDESKTSLKTNTERTTDDEAAPPLSTSASTLSTGEFAAFTALFEQLSKASTEITGKKPSVVDRDKWAELGELLITELKLAAGRTDTVSSVPAFLAEHLRRRLWKTDKARLDASGGPTEARERASSGGAEQKIDASNCPDCFGTNMRYVNPQTFEGGVTRCKHEKLASNSE